MDWLMNAFWVRVGWAVGELAIGAALIVAIVLIVVLYHTLRQAGCKHGRYVETSACDAVCADCGKNLGFIGTVRNSRIGIEA